MAVILYGSHTKYEYVTQIYSKWRSESSMKNITSNNETKSTMPKTMYILASIERLLKAGALLSITVVIVGFVIYASLKFSETSYLYKTHQNQYQYIISGVFLRTSVPAFVLFVFHTAVVFIIIYVFFRVFGFDWKVLRFGQESVVARSAENTTESRESMVLKKSLLKRVYQATIVLIFLMIPILLNVGYIFVTPTLNEYEIAAIQLTLLLLNAIARISLPFLIPHLFWEGGSRFHNTLSVGVLAALVSFMDIVVPFIATMFSSDLCFHQYFVG